MRARAASAERDDRVRDVQGAGNGGDAALAAPVEELPKQVFAEKDGQRWAEVIMRPSHVIYLKGEAFHHAYDDQGVWVYQPTR